MKRSEEIRVIIKLKIQEKDAIDIEANRKTIEINETVGNLRFELAKIINGFKNDEDITL